MQTKQQTFKSPSQFTKGSKNPPKTVQAKSKKTGKAMLGKAMQKLKH